MEDHMDHIFTVSNFNINLLRLYPFSFFLFKSEALKCVLLFFPFLTHMCVRLQGNQSIKFHRHNCNF